ncbi:MAG TPA: hypothetical protein VFX96_17385 [Pyrinomonadaceae bacterium]|nr:hypothetical protein [Pyrinomonadaceae bacterium]
MRRYVVPIVGALAVVVVAGFLLRYEIIRELECRLQRVYCSHECDQAFIRERFAIQDERNRLTEERNGRLGECADRFDRDSPAYQQCWAQVMEAFQPRMQELSQSEIFAVMVRDTCKENCEAICGERTARTGVIDVSTPVDVEVGCVEGGAPCFKEVPKICTVISGACGECWRTLCGGGEWAFESDVPLEVTLAAAADPAKSPRVLATSSARGKEAVLDVPKDIKLDMGERLYFGFNSREKTRGTVKVVIRRRR